MDWVLKASSARDLTDTSSIPGNQNREFFSVDLGFDIIGDGNVNKLNGQKGSTMASSPSRKTRVHNGSSQNVLCSVDGCTSDLSSCREYHRRHRVCERHSKTPVVLIRGKEQRFCQQCSRFHSLGEFDEVKRSCRKRLDGHNRRRRKPWADPLYLNCGSLLANNQGAKYLHFGGPQAYTTTHGSLTWPDEDKHHQQLHVIFQQSNYSNSFARIYKGREKKFPFLLATNPDVGNQAVPKVSSSQQALDTNASPDPAGKKSEKLTHLVDSKCALSLLSKHTMQTPGSSPSHLVQRDVIHLNQPTETSLQFDGLDQHLQSQLTSTVLVPDASHEANHLNGVIHFRPEGLMENGSSQLVSFSWN